MISVVVATYNRAKLLKRALETYMKQTVGLDYFEYIIVDDLSTDDTDRVLASFKKRGMNIMVLNPNEIGKPKLPDVWRDGCALRNAASTFATGNVIVSTHPEIMIPPDALESMELAVDANPNAWVTAIPYWLPPNDILDDLHSYDAMGWKRNLNNLRKLPGFYDPSWPGPVAAPGAPDYRNQNQEVRTTWESEVFWAMSMSKWREVGGFREFEAWGSVDMDWLARRHAMGIKTVFAKSQSGPHEENILMVYHQDHSSKRDMQKAFQELSEKKAVYPTKESAQKAGGLYSVYNHGPRERSTNGTLDGILGDHKSRYAFAAKYAHGKRILDIGCGTGYGSRLVGPVCSQYIGVDKDEESIQYAVEHYQNIRCTFWSDDASININYPDASVDMVLCFEVIEHIPWEDKAKVIGEVYRVLKPGGTFIFSTPQKGATAGTPWDKYMLTKDEFVDLFDPELWTNLDHFHQTHYGSEQDPRPGHNLKAEIMILGGTKK